MPTDAESLSEVRFCPEVEGRRRQSVPDCMDNQPHTRYGCHRHEWFRRLTVTEQRSCESRLYCPARDVVRCPVLCKLWPTAQSFESLGRLPCPEGVLRCVTIFSAYPTDRNAHLDFVRTCIVCLPAFANLCAVYALAVMLLWNGSRRSLALRLCFVVLRQVPRLGLVCGDLQRVRVQPAGAAAGRPAALNGAPPGP